MTINENIRKIRLEKGMTQKQVAEACGTVAPTIRAYEVGKANPKPATIVKIAKALGVSTAEIYGLPESEIVSKNYDQTTAAAIYHTILIENGNEVSEDAINLQRLMTAYKKLNTEGKATLVTRARELTFVPTYKSQNNASTSPIELRISLMLTWEELDDIMKAWSEEYFKNLPDPHIKTWWNDECWGIRFISISNATENRFLDLYTEFDTERKHKPNDETYTLQNALSDKILSEYLTKTGQITKPIKQSYATYHGVIFILED